MPTSPARSLLKKLIVAGLNASDPYQALLGTLSLRHSTLRVGHRAYDLSRFDRVLVVGAGKASARMAQALEHTLGARLGSGLVVVKTGHTLPLKRIRILEAGHPIPDRAGQQATQQLLSIIKPLTRRDVLFVLLSGGASSLLPAPVPGITLADKQRTTRLLLRSGATINEVNIVRKHLSLIKGGGLAASTQATIVTLILSDVIGDDLGSIGSGPTIADPSTFADAIGVLRRYKIWHAVPTSVRRYLQKGRKGRAPETLKPGSSRARSVSHQIIGNNRLMTRAVARAAKAAGLHTKLLLTPVTGEAQSAAKQFVGFAQSLPSRQDTLTRPCCIIAGGEPTVTVTGRGKGGRAQEFAAAASLEIARLPKTWVAALGTDGTDGPTDVAGAVVSGDTVACAQRTHIDLRVALKHNDTYPALKQLGCHIHTGPTGTNVNDLYLLLLL